MSGKSKPVLFLSLLLLPIAGCQADETPKIAFEVVGQLQDGKITEASGLARSQRESGLLWTINDHGSSNIVHALRYSGERVGEFLLKKTKTRDWEDLASFRLDDTPYLLVADIGDNDAERKYRTLYVVEEPTAEKKGEEKHEWQVDFVYPDGPRDAESAAVDIEREAVLILSKRDLPPRLYETPLRSASKDKVTVTLLGEIRSLRAPTRQEIEFAPKTKRYDWQPVGMDISADNRAAVILTYAAVYYYEREPDESWLQALNGRPLIAGLGNFEQAEAIAFGDAKRTVFVTGENKHERILRIDFDEVSPR